MPDNTENIRRAAGFAFYNTSNITFDSLLDDDANLARRLKSYINGLKDFENVTLGTNIIDYFEREVLPHAPDAWINPDFADEKDRNIRKVEKNILEMLREVMG